MHPRGLASGPIFFFFGARGREHPPSPGNPRRVSFDPEPVRCVEVYSQKRGWAPLKSLPGKPQSPRKLPAKTVHRRPRKAAPPSPSRSTTSALVQLGTTLQALGAQLVNSVVDCAV